MNDSPADLDRYELVPGVSEQRFSRFMRVIVRVMGNIFGATIFFVTQVLVKDNCHLDLEIFIVGLVALVVAETTFSHRAKLRAANLVRPDTFVFITPRTADLSDALRAIGPDRPGLPRHFAVTLGPKGSELWIRGRTEVPRCALSWNNSKMVASIVYAGGVPNRVPVPHGGRARATLISRPGETDGRQSTCLARMRSRLPSWPRRLSALR